MKSPAALAGLFLLATAGAGIAQVSGSGSIQVTGGASPQVTATGTASSTSAATSGSSSQSDPTILGSGNAAGSSNQTGDIRSTNRNFNRNSARGGNATAQGGQGGRSVSTSRGGTGQSVGNQVYVGLGGGGGSSGGGGQYTGADPYVGVNTTNYTGGYTQTLRNVPEIVAPSVNGGANGCAVGVSGGVAVAGFGITTGAGWSDSNCERRNLAALVYNTGDHDLAAEILCDAAEVRAARLRMGKPCIADQAPGSVPVATAAAPSSAVVTTDAQRVDPAILQRQQDAQQSQQPRPTAPVILTAGGTAAGQQSGLVKINDSLPVQRMIVPPRPGQTKPDWCETASPKDRVAWQQCQ